MNEILCAVVPRKFSEASAVTFGKVSKVRPVLFDSADDHAETNCQAVEQTGKRFDPFLGDCELLLVAKGKRFVQGNTQNFHWSIRVRFGWRRKVGPSPQEAKRNQSSRTVRERWAARLARTSPTHIPL